jgi:hypothetical protein
MQRQYVCLSVLVVLIGSVLPVYAQQAGSEPTPKRPRPELLILRVKVEVMHRTSEMLRSFALPSTNAS